MTETFKLTYATMFNPPEELHMRFEEALVKLKAGLGKEYGMIIDGKDRFSQEKFEDRSPGKYRVWCWGYFKKAMSKMPTTPWLPHERQRRCGAA